MSNKQRASDERQERALCSPIPLIVSFLVCGPLVAGLVWSVLTLPKDLPRIKPVLDEQIGSSGVNPVTAVLLDFRAYDTLLEIVVLLLAVLGGRALSTPRDQRHFGLIAPSSIFIGLLRVVVPLTILIAGYLLLSGMSAPGGAFQAGAILAAGLILVHLYDRHQLAFVSAGLERSLLIFGPAVFVSAALLSVAIGRPMLTYEQGWSQTMILVIEAAVTVSIAFILLALFAGGRLAFSSPSASERP